MADLAKPMATWSWVLGIDHASLRLLTGVVMLALWGFVECRVPRQCAVGGSGAGVIRWHRAVFATIALFIAMRHGVRLAFELAAGAAVTGQPGPPLLLA